MDDSILKWWASRCAIYHKERGMCTRYVPPLSYCIQLFEVFSTNTDFLHVQFYRICKDHWEKVCCLASWWVTSPWHGTVSKFWCLDFLRRSNVNGHLRMILAMETWRSFILHRSKEVFWHGWWMGSLKNWKPFRKSVCLCGSWKAPKFWGYCHLLPEDNLSFSVVVCCFIATPETVNIISTIMFNQSIPHLFRETGYFAWQFQIWQQKNPCTQAGVCGGCVGWRVCGNLGVTLDWLHIEGILWFSFGRGLGGSEKITHDSSNHGLIFWNLVDCHIFSFTNFKIQPPVFSNWGNHLWMSSSFSPRQKERWQTTFKLSFSWWVLLFYMVALDFIMVFFWWCFLLEY